MKNIKIKPALIFAIVAILAISIAVWQGCKKDPEPVKVDKPIITVPKSVTTEPTDAEVEALKTLQENQNAADKLRQEHDEAND